MMPRRWVQLAHWKTAASGGSTGADDVPSDVRLQFRLREEIFNLATLIVAEARGLR